MTRYIDANEFRKRIDHYPPDIRDTAKKELRYTPTADVVKVVRCKDCRWQTGLEEHTAWHPCDEVPVDDNWFCADGERKDDV